MINLIADRSLLAGMAVGATTLDSDVTGQAISNLQLKKHRPVSSGFWGKIRAAADIKKTALVVGLSILLAIVFVALINGFGGS